MPLWQGPKTSFHFNSRTGGVMSITWILVANASAAYLYANYGQKKVYRNSRNSDMRPSRQHLVSDRPGHNKSHGNGCGAYVSATDPKQHEARNFACRLAKELEQGRITNSYQRLILVASAPSLACNLGRNVRNLVSDNLEKDYTKASEKYLTKHLESRFTSNPPSRQR